MLHPHVNIKCGRHRPPCMNHQPHLEVYSLNASPDILQDFQLFSKHMAKGDPGKLVICFLEVEVSKCQGAPLVRGYQ